MHVIDITDRDANANPFPKALTLRGLSFTHNNPNNKYTSNNVKSVLNICLGRTCISYATTHIDKKGSIRYTTMKDSEDKLSAGGNPAIFQLIIVYIIQINQVKHVGSFRVRQNLALGKLTSITNADNSI